MTTLNFNCTQTVTATNLEVEEQSNEQAAKWVRYYCPALAIMGSILYVVHSWMAIA
jgi:hypothetical protein